MGRPPKPRVAQTAPNKDTPWFEAIQQALAGASGPMSCPEIADCIIERGIRRNGGATPAQTIAAILSTSLREEDSPFVRVTRGFYALKHSPLQTPLTPEASEAEASDNAQTGALRAFGMYWRRDSVVWSGQPRLVGRQGSGASDVNFAGQIGVYLLHDRDRVIYVGRASDTLYARLKAHTLDRLSGRWDRFSWFGLRGVSADGGLVQEDVPWTPNVVIETMEALLIESLEPPLNRRRGDNFSAVEFIQVTDPQIEKSQKQALLEEMKKNMGL